MLQEAALLTFRAPSSHAEINDVQWCPWRASVFAAVTAGGRIELWDIVQSVLAPVAVYQREGDPCSAPHEDRALPTIQIAWMLALGREYKLPYQSLDSQIFPLMCYQNRSAEAFKFKGSGFRF